MTRRGSSFAKTVPALSFNIPRGKAEHLEELVEAEEARAYGGVGA